MRCQNCNAVIINIVKNDVNRRFCNDKCRMQYYNNKQTPVSSDLLEPRKKKIKDELYFDIVNINRYRKDNADKDLREDREYHRLIKVADIKVVEIKRLESIQNRF